MAFGQTQGRDRAAAGSPHAASQNPSTAGTSAKELLQNAPSRTAVMQGQQSEHSLTCLTRP